MLAERDGASSKDVSPHGFVVEPYLGRRIDPLAWRMPLTVEARHTAGALTVLAA